MKNCTRQCFLVLAMSVSSQFVVAQPTESWTRYYNGPGGQLDRGRKIAIDAGNNVYVAGQSDAKGQNPDYAVVKYNPAGQQLWVARYDGPGKGDDYVFGLELDASGNVYVTGRSMGNGSLYDYATVKFDAAGALKWVARYNGPDNAHDVAKALKVDVSGNVYVTGLSDGNSSYVGNVIRTIKYNSLGEQQWVAVYDELPTGNTTNNSEEANSLALDPFGNVYITARSGSMKTIKYNSSGIEQWVRSSGGTNGRSILFDGTNIIVTGWGSNTVKYNPNGDVVWEANYVGPGNALAAFQDMAYDGSGNVYVTGDISGVGTSSNFITVMYDANGIQQWASIYSGTYNGIDLSRAIALGSSGNVYITGFSTVASGNRQSTMKITTIKYNNSGVQQWVAYSGTGGGGFDVAIDGTGAIVVAGESAGKSMDFATVKYIDGAITQVRPLPMTNTFAKYAIRNFPNPFKLNTTIAYELAKEGHVTVRVYDLVGHELAKLVDEKKPAGQHQVQFSAGRLASGTYIYKIQSGEYIETRRMILEK